MEKLENLIKVYRLGNSTLLLISDSDHYTLVM